MVDKDKVDKDMVDKDMFVVQFEALHAAMGESECGPRPYPPRLTCMVDQKIASNCTQASRRTGF